MSAFAHPFKAAPKITIEKSRSLAVDELYHAQNEIDVLRAENEALARKLAEQAHALAVADEIIHRRHLGGAFCR